ncbi:MAG: N-acetylneuraminate synthase [Parcubacteria group bacterium Gr01-1014_107]|nr:MAG: N-acetylneuraminate synthase [Parcubacteria group bacterium Gr01-1014_107]
MKKVIKIGKRRIGGNNPTFIVAEMSSNHEQSYRKAEALVKAAVQAGADAIKVQTFTPDTITLNSKKNWFLVGGKDNPKAWQGQTFYDLYKKAYMPWHWQPRLQKLAHRLGIEFFSTPFDETSVDFLEKIRVPCYKIAAYESTDFILLRKVAKTIKPVIVSVGFSTLPEVTFTIKTLRKYGAKDIVVLQCPTSYSDKAIPERTNLNTMLDIKKRFKVEVGLSDNMGGIKVPILAGALGAAVLEKHIVLKHGSKALDDRFSLDPKEFKAMVKKIRHQEKEKKWQEIAKGKVTYGPQTPAERYNRNFRRSLFVSKDVEKGEKLTKDNVKSVRPAYGLETRYYDRIIGRKARKDIEAGTPLSWKLVK